MSTVCATWRCTRELRGHYLMISMYSLSLPLLSLHLRYMTEASTFAGEKVLGSLSREITLSRMVLREEERRWEWGEIKIPGSNRGRGHRGVR